MKPTSQAAHGRFNPRAREGRDPYARPGFTDARRFQSTRPRRARPQLVFQYRFSIAVSIHAPAKGATLEIIRGSRQKRVSIHAPAKGATPYGGKGAYMLEVSIHAPAKGATEHNQGLRERIAVSIHAPAKGATREPKQSGRA